MPTQQPDTTILLVDDDESMRGFVASILRRNGYGVRVASDGQEAADILQSEPSAFHLVLTDLSMPRVNGLDLARQLHAAYPALPVILMSGDLGEWDLASESAPRIEKPFTAAALLQLIQAHLNARNLAPPCCQ